MREVQVKYAMLQMDLKSEKVRKLESVKVLDRIVSALAIGVNIIHHL